AWPPPPSIARRGRRRRPCCVKRLSALHRDLPVRPSRSFLKIELEIGRTNRRHVPRRGVAGRSVLRPTRRDALGEGRAADHQPFRFRERGCGGGVSSPHPAVTLSVKAGPPTTNLSVSGSGFPASTAIDIYFDTTDLALTVTNSSGSFSGIKILVP